MPSKILTSDIILRESLHVLTQKKVFLGMINTTYSKEFERSGSKIGDEIRVRRPNTFAIRKGRVAQPQETQERFETIKIDKQVGVDMTFTSKELTLDLDDFRERILEPAIATLVSDVEDQLLSMAVDVPMLYPSNIEPSNNIYADSQIYDWVDRCGYELDIELAPQKGRYALLNSYDESLLIDNLKTLYGDSKAIAQQFTEGKMDRFQGFSHKSTVHMPFYKVGRSAFKTDLKTVTSGISPGQVSDQDINFSAIQAGQNFLPVTAQRDGDWHKGDIVTVTHFNRVHPETKRVYRDCNATFVATQDAISGENLTVWPPIYKDKGKYQNVATEGDQGHVAIYAINNGLKPQRQNLYFHKDAFTMATVDLEMPNDCDFKARETHEGISMRIIRKYDINQDEFPCRIDMLYGFKTIRPELARRIMGGSVH